MGEIKNKLEGAADKAEATIKEGLGKITGDQELELEGKVKGKVIEAKEKLVDIKDDILDKVNDKLDK